MTQGPEAESLETYDSPFPHFARPQLPWCLRVAKSHCENQEAPGNTSPCCIPELLPFLGLCFPICLRKWTSVASWALTGLYGLHSRDNGFFFFFGSVFSFLMKAG